MSARAAQLFQTADEQISDLIALLGPADEAALHRPCARREKLGDGTVAATAMHTADNYHRIAEYVGSETQPIRKPERRRHNQQSSGHGPRGGQDHSHGPAAYRSENISPRSLLERLASARTRLSALAELSDERLAAVPPASEMRFADGQRTLEQIVTRLLNHQRHQCEALAAALIGSGRAPQAADRRRPPRLARRPPHRC